MEEYSQKEENTFREALFRRMDTQDNSLGKILEQTQKTNGRVNSLETSRTQIWTAISILLFLGGAIITLSISAINTKIEKGIKDALSQLEDYDQIIIDNK
ncbi:MAG TPA: hypothetical protein PLQ20_03215 [Candidatus Paceibacterota bacterium]|nr:hypothetical protein [Candidatus Paceibacterota bacterium]